MESSPVTLAFSHARKAAYLSTESTWKQAAAEHNSASNEYNRASFRTNDSEALRILALLEREHSKLADIIKTKDAQKLSGQPAEGKRIDSDRSPRNVSVAEKASSPTAKHGSALSAARFGSQIRDSSPSLARDMASRRGIPQAGRNPPSAAAQARARAASPESHRRTASGNQPRIPASIIDSHGLRQANKAHKISEDDAAFANFFNDVTTGTMSKVSKAMALAGWQFSHDETPAESNKLDRSTVVASNEPDPKKIFSQAALNAIEDEHRQRGSTGRVFGPAESFYVVQKGGGTYSYADIAKVQHQHKQQQQEHMRNIDEEDEEIFVDARDVRDPSSSPKLNRSVSQPETRSSFSKNRTHEELELENVTLKQTLEQLATRLTEFETHAQDASMAALTQSIASLHNHPNPYLQNSPNSGDKRIERKVSTKSSIDPRAAAADQSTLDRISKLEKALTEASEERQKYVSVATKQDKMIKQYHARWEDLKKNAKQKDRLRKEKSGAEKGGEASLATAVVATVATADNLVSANEPWKGDG